MSDKPSNRKLEAYANSTRHNQEQQFRRASRRESRHIVHSECQQQKKQRTDYNLQQANSNVMVNERGQMKKQEERGENLSFSGCGFLGIYHVGVASSFNQYAPHLSNHKVSGTSAGALAAVALICGDVQLAQAAVDFVKVAIDARSRSLGPFHPSFDINALLTNSLERGLPEDIHLKLSGRLHISLTRVYDGENVIISKFDSRQDVIQAILCSCFVPFWSGIVAPKFKGVTYTDGGFSNNLLILDDKTITVSPFAGEADICPQDDAYNLLSFSLSNTSVSITPHNLYRASHALMPPPTDVLNELCARGFADGIRFLQKMNFIPIDICVEIRSSLIVTEIMEDEITEIITEKKTNEISSYRNNYNNNSSSSSSNDTLTTQQQAGLLQSISGCCRIDLKSRLSRRRTTTTMRTTSTTGCLVNGLLATAAAGGERIVIDIERTLPLLIDSIPLYPFFYACASAALVYLMECLRSGAKVGEKHQKRVLKLVQYFSI